MTIIFNGFHEAPYFPIINAVLEIYQPKSCHVIFQDEKVFINQEIKATYYPCAVLTHETHYELDQNSLIPLDANLIQEMADCEAVCLKMLDRDEVYGPMTYNRRKTIYLKHLRYWNHVIETDNVDLFITSNIPHVVYDFIIYSLCKLKGIKTILFVQFQKKFSTLIIDWKDPTPGMQEKCLNLDKKIIATDLSVRLKAEWDLQNGGGDTTPFYVNLFQETYQKPERNIFISLFHFMKRQMVKLFHAPRKHLEHILNPEQLVKWINYHWRNYSQKRSEIKSCEFYESICVEPDLEKEYIYLPLHSQPELSTSPMGGVFVDQLLIVQLVSYCVPENVLIYVKEHPTQYLHKRGPGFYQSLAAIKNVRLVSRKFGSAKLIKNCQAVGTCVGTAGWEALFKGKPVLLFGNTFFQNAPGSFIINSLRDCQIAIGQILSGEEIFSQQQLLNFLYLLNEYFIYADIDPMYKDDDGTGWEQNTTILATALRNFLRI